MDPENRKFGRGPRELTGAVDLISQFKLLPHHEYFCKRQLPLSISDTHYLHNVVGDTEIRKGEGMQLDQLIEDASFSREMNASIKPFDLDVLGEAFQLRETSPIDLPSVRIWLMCFCDSSLGNNVPLFPLRFPVVLSTCLL
nr:mediator of RNA polymerase II transcription subunit 19a-like [Ipomoea trifida]GMD14006.1 mediator of RNA polymerase II transcription subunit 19A-like isoform X1 [Ipomoea batatas]GMD17309.1 mediator of RNA polymerase II transcription subunit 19A-like isoform X1 [Ipomoea batatas]